MSVVLHCPIQLGSLSQSYDASWSLQDNNDSMSFPDQYAIGLTDNQQSFLSIIDVQKKNLGTYICTVSVSNPYTGEMWTFSRPITLGKPVAQ